MSKDIFVSYRRNDESGTTGRIYDYLLRETGVPRERVFLDVGNLVPGTNFVQEINRRLATCEVFLAVIGRRWLDESDETGGRRLDDPNDFVRLEISAALGRSIPVIPILVDGARMPKESELPANIRLLCQQHAIQLQNAHFARDIQPLVTAIQWHQRLPTAQKPRQTAKKAGKKAPGLKELGLGFVKTIAALFSAPPVASSPATPRTGYQTPPSPKKEPERSIISQSEISKLGGLFYLAEGGDPVYLYEIATRFEKGHGVEKNLSIARHYYQRSSKAGYVRAQRRLERLPPTG